MSDTPEWPAMMRLSDLERMLEDKSPEQIKEAVQHVGYRSVWVAALNIEIRKRLQRRRLKGYPPKVFLSYKWYGPETKRWVRAVADALRDGGYEVLLDQYDCMVETHMDVPRYVATMADCHIALIIITPDYLRAGTWVFDEWQMIQCLSQAGFLKRIVILQEGDASVEGDVQRKLGVCMDEVIDLRGVDNPYEQIAGRLQYTGERLSDAQTEELLQVTKQLESLITEGRIRDAKELGSAYPQYHWTDEMGLQIARLYAAAGHREQALSIAQKLLADCDSTDRSRESLGEVLHKCGQSRQALTCLHPVLGIPGRAAAHYMFGNVLDDLGASAAGARHLEFARLELGESELLLNDLGVMYQHAGQVVHAEKCFNIALSCNPSYSLTLANLVLLYQKTGRLNDAATLQRHAERDVPNFTHILEAVNRAFAQPVRQPVVGANLVRFDCDHCRCTLELDVQQQRICAWCSDIETTTNATCRICGHDGRVLVDNLVMPLETNLPNVAVACPVCRNGRLSCATGDQIGTHP